MRIRTLGLFLGLALLAAPSGGSNAAVPSGYRLVAAENAIPETIFYAVALAESGRRIDAMAIRRPWPWTLNVGGEGRFYPSRRTAAAALVTAIETRQRSIDIGLMQVNWGYHRDKLGSTSLALEPYHNLRVAAEILGACYRSLGDWWEAVGCYHAPANAMRAARYRDRVLGIWQRIERTG